MKVANWGNYPVTDAELKTFVSADGLRGFIASAPALIARGLGRCYGDSALSPLIASTLKYDRFLEFDAEKGELACHSGASLADILELIVPRGWFLPVTPGTRHVTLGGAIASDVHGKNHHIDGSFGRHVLSMELLLADGSRVVCSPAENRELFGATVGGMGLTGVILSARIGLRRVASAYIKQTTVIAKNLDEVMDRFEESKNVPYSVAWIDCLAGGASAGRSVLFLGDHAPAESAGRNPFHVPPRVGLAVPFFFPAFALNGLSVKVFNALFYAKSRAEEGRLVDYGTFFYPLDGISHWNRIYGRRGFCQYQCVLPMAHSRAGLRKIIGKVASAGEGSFLAVLKLLGKGDGLLSFPMEGYTLALDFPVTKNLFPLLEELDKLVMESGGRIYLAKDARMGREIFRSGYPRLDEFRELKGRFDPSGKFQSLQSRRLGI